MSYTPAHSPAKMRCLMHRKCGEWILWPRRGKGVRNQWYCSPKCYAAGYRDRKRRDVPATVVCQWEGCKAEAKRTPGRRAQRFCSRECRTAFHNDRRETARRRFRQKWGIAKIARSFGVSEAQVRRWVGRS